MSWNQVVYLRRAKARLYGRADFFHGLCQLRYYLLSCKKSTSSSASQKPTFSILLLFSSICPFSFAVLPNLIKNAL